MCVHPLLQTILFSCLLGSAASLPTQSITIDGVTNHGDPHLICTPTKWTDIVLFFLLNYIAHAATVASYPGETTTAIWNALVATLFPTFGIMRALNLITRHSSVPLGKSDLEKAARSGALCMVVRTTSWTPKQGDSMADVWVAETPESGGTIEGNEFPLESLMGESHGITTVPRENTAILSIYVPLWMREASANFTYTDTHDIYANARRVFGAHSLPDGYALAFVPRNTKVLGLGLVDPDKPTLSSSCNLIKGAAALLQLLYASFTLYESRGDQIRRYGFTAFGLTVVPYVVMSVLNLIANMLTPNYPTLYLVKSEVMDEAERRKGSLFDYVVGRIETFVESDTDDAIMEDWYKTSGKFEDDDGLLVLSPGREQSKKFIVRVVSSAGHRRTVHIPACPRFQRTDGIQEMKYKAFPLSAVHRFWYWLIPFLQRFLRRLLPKPLDFLPADQVVRPGLEDKIKFLPTEFILVWMIASIQFNIVGILSRFLPGGSTLAQRFWIVAWYLSGFAIGFHLARTKYRPRVSHHVFPLLCSAPAIGGLIVVSLMLKGYGRCLRIG